MIFSSRNHHSPLSFFRKAGIIALLLTATFFTNNGECSVSAENPSPAKASGDLRVLHVRGADSGDIPAQLKKYSNYLRRAGAQHWKLEEEKSVRLQGTQPLEVALPGKLGKAIISVDAKKVATGGPQDDHRRPQECPRKAPEEPQDTGFDMDLTRI